MHKGTILLTDAETREQAISQIREFMEEYGDDKVWDWYVVGGRWHGLLAENHDKFYAESKKILESKGDFVYQSEVDKKQKELQALWESLGESGQNPCCNHYKLPDDGEDMDAMPLDKCMAKVKEWHQDPIKAGKEAEVDAQEWLNGKRGKDNYNMYGFCLRKAGEIYQQNFSFEANIYNINSCNFEIPKDIDGWWAVIVDMHT